MNIKKAVKKKIYNHYLQAKRKSTNYYELLSTLEGVNLDALSDDEVKSIDKIWGKFLDNKLTWEYWRLYKTFGHFSEWFVPDDAYIPFIVRVLNPLHITRTLENKSLYPYRLRGVNQPEVIVNCIRGTFYDGKGELISEREAISLLKAQEEFIIKKAVGSCSGIGVKKIKADSEQSLKKELQHFGDYFICQKLVEQSSLTKQFHPASLNTFRVNTLNLNGRITADTIMFKHGNNNSFVDNGHAGGLFMGVDCDGTFKPIAFDAYYHQYPESPTGIKYKDIVIPEVSKLIDAAIEWHRKYYPDLGFIGWDIALDKDNTPMLIESNLGYPGILIVQLSADKPIFGDRTSEVMEYVEKHKHEVPMFDFMGSSL